MVEAVEEMEKNGVIKGKHQSPNVKLIGYRGRWYDITSMIKKHPGGEVIEKFVNHDATSVIDSMHKYDVLKHRKPVGTYKFFQGKFDKDMNDLEHKFRRKGYYDDSCQWCVIKCVSVMSLLGIAFLLVRNGMLSTSLSGKVSAGILLALFWQQTGMLMHDFMHSQGFRNRYLDEKVGIFFGTFCFGISARWWKDEHILHHALTNTVDYATNFCDPQAREEAWVQNEKLFPFHMSALQSYCVKIQHWIFVPLCVGVGRVAIMVDSLRQEQRIDVWVAWLLHWLWIFAFFSYFDTWRSIALVYWIGCLGEGVLHIQLLLNHYAKSFYTLSEKHKEEYFRTMVDSNLNIVCPWWFDWFHGGLNFHIEHHSFPRLPRNRLREASFYIKEICNRHQIKYDECGFFAALWRTLRHLFEQSQKYQKIVKD